MPDRCGPQPRAARSRPCYGEAVPSDAEVEALLAAAAATRKKPSRGLWIAAIVVSAICVVALGWGLINDWDEPPEQTTIQPAARDGGGGFGLGLMVGIGVGIPYLSGTFERIVIVTIIK